MSPLCSYAAGVTPGRVLLLRFFEGHSMSEEKWLDKEITPYWLIGQLRSTSLPRTKAGRRKLRLFACGGCRLIWSQLHDPRLRGAVEVAERFADGNTTGSQLSHMRPPP